MKKKILIVMSDYYETISKGLLHNAKKVLQEPFDLITQAVTKAVMDLSIKYKKPIGNGIITSLNMKQAIERSNLKQKNKGIESADAVISVINLI